MITDYSQLTSARTMGWVEGEFPSSCQEMALPQCSAPSGPGYIFKAGQNSNDHERIFMDIRTGGQHLHYVSNSRVSLKWWWFVPGGITGSRTTTGPYETQSNCFVQKPQFIQNCALTLQKIPKYEHITPVLDFDHWLTAPVEYNTGSVFSSSASTVTLLPTSRNCWTT